MSKSQVMRIIAVIVILSMMLTPVAYAESQLPVVSDGPSAPAETAAVESPRLIVELASPPLAVAYLTNVTAAAVNGKLDANSSAAQAYVNQLRAEQAAFVSNMQAALTGAAVATFRNEAGFTEEASYQIVFNGLAVTPGATPKRMRCAPWRNCPVSRMFILTRHITPSFTPVRP